MPLSVCLSVSILILRISKEGIPRQRLEANKPPERGARREEEAGEGELSAIEGEFIGMEGEFKADKVGEGWEPDWYWGGPGAHPGGPPV